MGSQYQREEWLVSQISVARSAESGEQQHHFTFNSLQHPKSRALGNSKEQEKFT